jgi:hypothetical protein
VNFVLLGKTDMYVLV